MASSVCVCVMQASLLYAHTHTHWVMVKEPRQVYASRYHPAAWLTTTGRKEPRSPRAPETSCNVT
jgi:hypothetical protein